MPHQLQRKLSLVSILLAMVAAGCSDTPPHQRADIDAKADDTTTSTAADDVLAPGDPAEPTSSASAAQQSKKSTPGPGPQTMPGRSATTVTTQASGGPGATTTTTITAGAASGSCPDARYCPKYALERPWQTDAQGRAVVRYRINPTPPPASSLTSEQIIEAIKAGAATWMAANPKVIFIFDGTTADPPAGGKNIVGFDAHFTSGVVRYPLSGTYANAFDMILSSKDGWDWRPCQPPEKPCDEYPSDRSVDVQDVVTHEWGHVLGLAHVDDELTMSTVDTRRAGFVNRRGVTLGLGDVLGVRKFYPCECPMPALYRP